MVKREYMSWNTNLSRKINLQLNSNLNLKSYLLECSPYHSFCFFLLKNPNYVSG